MNSDSSSMAMRRWEDDGGPATPQKNDGGARIQGAAIDLVVLPFRDYTTQHREHLEGLWNRLAEAPTNETTQFVIVDTQRVERPGAVLIGILHAAAGLMKVKQCRLVLVGDLHGNLVVTRLNNICPVFPDREAAFRWCENNLTGK